MAAMTRYSARLAFTKAPHTLPLVIAALERIKYDVLDGYPEALQRAVWGLGEDPSVFYMVAWAHLLCFTSRVTVPERSLSLLAAWGLTSGSPMSHAAAAIVPRSAVAEPPLKLPDLASSQQHNCILGLPSGPACCPVPELNLCNSSFNRQRAAPCCFSDSCYCLSAPAA